MKISLTIPPTFLQKFNAVILKISLTPQKLMQKRRSTPGDKWEVEMEVDTRRKTLITFSAKFNSGNSAEFNGQTDGRTNERTDGRTNGRNFRRNSAGIPATNRSQEISSTGDIFKIISLSSPDNFTEVFIKSASSNSAIIFPLLISLVMWKTHGNLTIT